MKHYSNQLCVDSFVTGYRFRSLTNEVYKRNDTVIENGLLNCIWTKIGWTNICIGRDRKLPEKKICSFFEVSRFLRFKTSFFECK